MEERRAGMGVDARIRGERASSEGGIEREEEERPTTTTYVKAGEGDRVENSLGRSSSKTRSISYDEDDDDDERGKKREGRTGRRRLKTYQWLTSCFCGDDDDTIRSLEGERTIEELDAEADALGPIVVAASPFEKAREAPVDLAPDDGVAREEEAARLRFDIDRAEAEERLRARELKVKREEDALRAREEALAERETALEREREETDRRVAELREEEKRLMNVSARRQAAVAAAAAATGRDSNGETSVRDDGDLSGVGEAGLKTELNRMRKTTKQFTEKERAMLEQINALRRARDASESRVRSLADELKDTKKDYEMWVREEETAERRYAASNVARQSPAPSSPSPAKPDLNEGDLPDWLRSPEPAVKRTHANGNDGGDGQESGASPTYKKFSPGKLIIPDDVATPVRNGDANGAQHPVFSAVRNGRISEAQDILVRNLAEFDVNTRDSFGNTVLIVAAQNNRKRVTKMCVKAGVPLDAKNKQGNTALHYCYGYGYFELGEYLINKGANENVVNAAGETPIDGLSVDQRRSLRAVRESLAEASAKSNAARRRHPVHDTDASPSYSDAESIVAFTDDDADA